MNVTGLTPLIVVSGLLTAVVVTGCSSSSSSSQGAESPQTCEQLAGLQIPATVIGLPTSGGDVTDAVLTPASGEGAARVPEHCLVTGRLLPVDPEAPEIRFRVALPEDWNSKVMMFGGGGFNGTIPNIVGNISNGPADQPTPIGRGYATFASDSGHQANELGSQDGRWGLNDEAVQNFAGDALKKTRDAAVHIVRTRYAAEPERAYFAGGSTGGREALTVIRRWPGDWDGAIAWYPAWNNVSALLAGHRMSLALAQPGAYPGAAERQLLLDAAMEACDGLDGLVDGVISDQRECNDIFDPATAMVNDAPLRCTDGEDLGDHCLSDAQIQALRVIDGPMTFSFTLASGETGYPGYNVWGADLGITTIETAVQPVVTFLALGTSQPAIPMPATAPYISTLTDQWIRYPVTRDPSFDSSTFDPENPGVWVDRLSELSEGLNAGTDLSGFVERGGKLLLAHGLTDVLVSSRATEIYYQLLVDQLGQETVESFVRYYEVPGLGHAVSSQFNATWDSLTALERWVEHAEAPENEVTTDTIGVPGRTRPLCDYPAWPRYVDGGDPMSAESFECVLE